MSVISSNVEKNNLKNSILTKVHFNGAIGFDKTKPMCIRLYTVLSEATQIKRNGGPTDHMLFSLNTDMRLESELTAKAAVYASYNFDWLAMRKACVGGVLMPLAMFNAVNKECWGAELFASRGFV